MSDGEPVSPPPCLQNALPQAAKRGISHPNGGCLLGGSGLDRDDWVSPNPRQYHHRLPRFLPNISRLLEKCVIPYKPFITTLPAGDGFVSGINIVRGFQRLDLTSIRAEIED